MITNCGLGNPELTNLPRKLNIGLSPSRDDFPHTHINDVGLKAYPDPETGEVRHAEMTLLSTLLCTFCVGLKAHPDPETSEVRRAESALLHLLSSAAFSLREEERVAEGSCCTCCIEGKAWWCCR